MTSAPCWMRPGADETALYGQGTDGGSMCAMFAATYPGSDRRSPPVVRPVERPVAAGVPWGWAKEDLAAFFTLIENWGDEDGSAPLLRGVGLSSIADDADAEKRWAHTLRNASSRGDALIHGGRSWDQDFRPVLPSIHVPTAIIARTWDEGDEAAAEWMAPQIPGARADQAPEVVDFPPISATRRRTSAWLRSSSQRSEKRRPSSIVCSRLSSSRLRASSARRQPRR